MYLSLEGETKHGKTHLALTAPAPILYISLDRGFDDLKPSFAGKEIHPVDFHLPPIYETPEETKAKMAAGDLRARIEVQKAQAERRAAKMVDTAADYWGRFRKLWSDAMNPKNGVKTVVVDTASALWELLAFAKFGKLTQVPPMLWGPVNAEFKSLMLSPYNTRAVNVILIHHVGDDYADNADGSSRKTGTRKRKGFKEIGQIPQWIVKCSRADATTAMIKKGEPRTRFVAEILDSGVRPETNGARLETGREDAETWEALGGGLWEAQENSPPPTIPVLGKLMWPETSLNSWE